MNEYNLRQQAAKLLRQAAEYEANIPLFREQARGLIAEADQLAQANRPDDSRPPALVAAEKALASNSVVLMKLRREELIAVMQDFGRRSVACQDKAESDRLYALVKKWDVVYQALWKRMQELTVKAEAKKQDEDRRAQRRIERKQEEAAREECAKARQRCLDRMQDNQVQKP